MTPEQAIQELESIAGGLCGGHYEPRNEREAELGARLLACHATLQFAVHDAAKWYRNKEAVFVANAMLQAARPTIHAMLNMEQAIKEYNKK